MNISITSSHAHTCLTTPSNFALILNLNAIKNTNSTKCITNNSPSNVLMIHISLFLLVQRASFMLINVHTFATTLRKCTTQNKICHIFSHINLQITIKYCLHIPRHIPLGTRTHHYLYKTLHT